MGSRGAGGQEIPITHFFQARRESVFRAWTDPDELAAWFGPAEMATPRERIRIDLRVGGRYELTMVRRDGGGEFAIGYEIVELVEPKLIVLRSDPMPDAGTQEGRVIRVEFHDRGLETRVMLSELPLPPDVPDGAEAGWRAAVDKLKAHLASGLPAGTLNPLRPLLTPRVLLRTGLAVAIAAVFGVMTESPGMVFMLGFFAVHTFFSEVDDAWRGGSRPRRLSYGPAFLFAALGALAWAASTLAESEVGSEVGPGFAAILILWMSAARGWVRGKHLEERERV